MIRRLGNGATRIVIKDHVSEDSTRDLQAETVLLAHVNKTIHHGSVTLSRSFLYRRERNQFQRPAVVIGAWQLGITAKIVVKQENVELTDARTTTIAVIFMKATHKMETQILDNIYKLGH